MGSSIDVELGGVKGQTEGSANAWAEGLSVAKGENTSIVDLRLNKRSLIEVTIESELA